MFKKTLFILSAIFLPLFGNNLVNQDTTEYKSPRLAGDSLAIKPLKKERTEEVKSFKSIFSNGEIKGLLRYSTQYRDTNYHSTQSGTSPQNNNKQQYSAFGGYLGYETAALNNFSLGITFYTAHKLGNNPVGRIGLGGLDESDGSASSYSVLGEAYLKYKTKAHDIRIGRREMPNYRFISLSNIRFSPITHEGITYDNTMFKNIEFTLARITKQKARNSDKFEGMARSARISQNSIRGQYDSTNYINDNYVGSKKAMNVLSFRMKKSNLNLELWDYFVEDFVNTVYLYGDYTFDINKATSFTTAFQYAQQNNVENSIAGDIDTSFYGLKAQLAFKYGVTIFSAYNEVAYNENSYDGGTLFVRWGTPQMFNSYQVQDSELAGTKSLGIGLQLELGHMGILPNTVIRFRHANYNMPDAIVQKDAAQDRSESTFDLRYSFSKNDGFGIFTSMDGLSVQFRVAYDNYKTDYNYDAYKLYHGYSFEDVTKSFVDTRLYIDYIF